MTRFRHLFLLGIAGAITFVPVAGLAQDWQAHSVDKTTSGVSGTPRKSGGQIDPVDARTIGYSTWCLAHTNYNGYDAVNVVGSFNVDWYVDWIGSGPMPETATGLVEVTESQYIAGDHISEITVSGDAGGVITGSGAGFETFLPYSWSGIGYAPPDSASGSGYMVIEFYKVEVSPGVFRMRGQMIGGVQQGATADCWSGVGGMATATVRMWMSGTLELIEMNGQSL